MRFSFRSTGLDELTPRVADVETKFSNAVRWAGQSVKEVAVTINDCNGPKGGIDKVCRVSVSLTRARRVVLEDRDANVYAALARLVERTSRSLHGVLDRKKMRESIRYMPVLEQQA